MAGLYLSQASTALLVVQTWVCGVTVRCGAVSARAHAHTWHNETTGLAIGRNEIRAGLTRPVGALLSGTRQAANVLESRRADG